MTLLRRDPERRGDGVPSDLSPDGLLRGLIENVPAAVYVGEAPSGLIRMFNRRAVVLWGRPPKMGDVDERFCGSFRLRRPDGSVLPHAESPDCQEGESR
jgi:hypothetical protein